MTKLNMKTLAFQKVWVEPTFHTRNDSRTGGGGSPPAENRWLSTKCLFALRAIWVRVPGDIPCVA